MPWLSHASNRCFSCPVCRGIRVQFALESLSSLARNQCPVCRGIRKQVKASIRAKVEHPFHIIKNLFRHRKTRYRGLAKNTAQLYALFGLANLFIVKRRLLGPDGTVAS